MWRRQAQQFWALGDMSASSANSALPLPEKTQQPASASGSPYRQLFAAHGSPWFFVAGMIARFPSGMMTLSIVMMLTHSRANYSLPSLVASTAILSNALLAPQLSRLADRYGQSRIALPAMAVAVSAFIALIFGARLLWPGWALFACAMAAGCIPNFGAFSRARWSHVYSGTPLLRTAFALEALCEELVWTCAPLIVIWCTTRFFPEAGLAAAALLFTSGGLFFCAQRRSEPPPHMPVQTRGSTRGVVRDRPAILSAVVLISSLVLLGFGGFFGVIEVATTAFAKSLGVPEKIFYPLSLCAVGSLIGGLLYGRRSWSLSLRRQFLVVTGVFFASTLLFFFVGGLWGLTLFCFLSGGMSAPTIIISMALIESLVEKRRLTESMTWGLVSPLVGMALGAALAGPVVDWAGPQRAFYGVSAFGALTFAVALGGQRWLATRPR